MSMVMIILKTEEDVQKKRIPNKELCADAHQQG